MCYVTSAFPPLNLTPATPESINVVLCENIPAHRVPVFFWGVGVSKSGSRPHWGAGPPFGGPQNLQNRKLPSKEISMILLNVFLFFCQEESAVLKVPPSMGCLEFGIGSELGKPKVKGERSFWDVGLKNKSIDR